MAVGGGRTASEAMAGAFVTALAYVFFFELNDWLFSLAKVSDNISWVFLPAAIRMLAVLLFGWAGVLGLFVGSLTVIVNQMATHPGHVLALAGLSSVPSLLVARMVQGALQIADDFGGMTGRQLLGFGLAGGLANSLVHTLYFVGREGALEPFHGFIPMFVGDSIGTLLMLYLGAFALRRFRHVPSTD